jgi:hypothetical protein
MTLALVAAVALFAAGCATTGAPVAGTKAPAGYRYVCNCGPECQCGSNAAKPGNCACGKPMVLKKVLAEDAANYYVCGCPDCKCDALNPKNPKQCSCAKELKAFPKKGAYTCACPGCDCDMQANNPGKCTCGNDMKPQKKYGQRPGDSARRTGPGAVSFQ